MASTLQSAVTSIHINNCVTRTFIDIGAFRPLILLFFLVATLTAVWYDYSKSQVSVYVFSH